MKAKKILLKNTLMPINEENWKKIEASKGKIHLISTSRMYYSKLFYTTWYNNSERWFKYD